MKAQDKLRIDKFSSFYRQSFSSIDLNGRIIIIPSYKEGIKHTFSGRRIKRGLYKSSLGLLINADINGSLNILKKAIPEAFA